MRRFLGWMAMVVGLLGAVVCLLMVGAIWVGHSTAQAQAAALIAAIDGPLGQASGALGAAETRLSGLERRVGALKARAEQLAANPALEEQARAELLAIADREIGTDYAALRERYLAARDQAAAVLTVRDRLTALPFLHRPSDGLVERVASVDAQLQALDESLAGLRSSLESRNLSLNETAARLTTRAEDVEARLSGYGESLAAYTEALETAQARLPDFSASIAGVITWTAVALTLAALYGVILHVALFLLGRIWAREDAPAAPRVSVAPPRTSAR